MSLKSLVKRALLRLEEFSGAEWLRDKIWTAQGVLPAVVVLFHRVTDSIPEDGITVSTARFQAIISLLRERYRLIPLSQLLDCLKHRQAWPPRTLSVTFDDGYRDNYEFAAPILSEFGVPATFFVTVDAIGKDLVLPWDEHLRGRVPWMDWSHLRELHAQGFEIGSHTLTHCDLGQVRGLSAWHEISTSKAILEDALGASVSLFAYPFGGRGNMLEDNRRLVKQAGYRCCCSGYGGFVTLASNPFDLQRIAVNNWFEVLGDLEFELRIAAPWRWLEVTRDQSLALL